MKQGDVRVVNPWNAAIPSRVTRDPPGSPGSGFGEESLTRRAPGANDLRR